MAIDPKQIIETDDKGRPKLVKCKYCKTDIKIKKSRFASQSLRGHEANCPMNPKVIARKQNRALKPPDTSLSNEQPTPAPINTEKIEPGEPAKSPNFGELGPSPTQEPPPQSPIPGYEYYQDETVAVTRLPASFIKDLVKAGLSINWDFVIAYAKKHELETPTRLEMSDETARIVGIVISHKIGPIQESWGIVFLLLAPYVLAPWASVMAQNPDSIMRNGIKKIPGLSKFFKDEEQEPAEDED